MMKKHSSISMLIVFLACTILAGISCDQKRESSIFLIEGNIIGLDIDLLFGGYPPELVESNLVIPFAKYLSKNEHIESVKYQIHPTYFRVFINTSNPKGEVAMQNELLGLIDGLPIVSESLNGPEGVPSVPDNRKVYIATNNLYVGAADQFYILRKPLLLPMSKMTEQKISELVPDVSGIRLLVRYDKSRLIQYGIQFEDISDIISARYIDLKEGSSVLIEDMDGLKNLSLPNEFGAQIPLEAIAEVEYIYDGINRPWTSISEIRE